LEYFEVATKLGLYSVFNVSGISTQFSRWSSQPTSKWLRQRAVVRNYVVNGSTADTPANFYVTPKFVISWRHVGSLAKEVVLTVGIAVRSVAPNLAASALFP
jgi:hypothetical protein